MTDVQGGREFVERNHSRIPATIFKAADVLLAEAGNLRELFLGQPFFQPNASNVLPDQLAHIHAPRSADYAF